MGLKVRVLNTTILKILVQTDSCKMTPNNSKFCNIWVIDTSNTRCSNIDNPKVKSEDCISEEISLSASQTNNIKQ